MLNIVNINKNFGRFSLKNINLKINDGEYFVILGSSGAGKTVLLEIIAGLISPSDGNIFINDTLIDKFPPEKRGIGLVYQDYNLFPAMNVRENIEFGLKIKKISKKEIERKIKEVSMLLQIGEILESDPSKLSGGEKQRAAIARALVLEPKIMLFDEPLSSLDSPLRESLRKELKKIHLLAKSIFIHVTHDFEEAVFLAEHMALMKEGEILQYGKPEDIMLRPANAFVAGFVGIKNIFNGTLESDISGLKVFRSDKLRLFVESELNGECSVSIPAEDVLLSNDKISSSARNSLEGTIINIAPRGRLKEIIVDIGKDIAVLVTGKSMAELKMTIGKKIWVTLKTSSIHVF